MRHLRILCLSLLCLVLGVVLFGPEGKKPKGFSPHRILTGRAHDPTWEIPALTEEKSAELSQALDQPYHFFNRGGQCAVFFSADGRYVLKLLIKRLYTVPNWLEHIPFLREKKSAKKQDKLLRDFSSYKIAFEELSLETATLYIHLNPTEHLPLVSVTDHKNQTHAIDLNTTDFILQQRAVLIPDALGALLEAGDREGAKHIITSLSQLIAHCCEKAIYDRDPSVFTNCGIVGNQAVKIDIGGFIRKHPLDPQEEFLRTTAPLRTWLAQRDQELCAYLDAQCDVKSRGVQ